MDVREILGIVSIAGALYCGAAYIYAYVLKPRGDRRMHLAGLLFTGIALAGVPGAIAERPSMLAAIFLVTGLSASMVCQALTGLRGRRSDRRSSDVRVLEDRRAPQASRIESQAA